MDMDMDIDTNMDMDMDTDTDISSLCTTPVFTVYMTHTSTYVISSGKMECQLPAH